ncbi:hypothetical protein ONZ45_g16529 [Pleurotus djamor]|nr:hypothetical protein ONZ45_g16529 [Pleurotus djamor]
MVPTTSKALSSVSLPPYFPIDHPVDLEPRPILRDDMIIAVMGPTGSGKSSFINTATKSNRAAVGHHLESCTQAITAYGCRHPDGNRDVVFVDTPGFDDTNRSDGDILKSIANWLVSMYKSKITLSGIIYLHRISDNRMAGTPLQNLQVFRKLCGAPALSNVILTTTFWDQVDDATGRLREAELGSNYWRSMIVAGSRVSHFRHSYESAWGTVGQFQYVPQPRPLLIQQEMVIQGKSLSQTSAGSALLQWLAKCINDIRQTIRSIEAQLRSLPKGANSQASRSIKEHENHIYIIKRQQTALRKNTIDFVRPSLLVHITTPNVQPQQSEPSQPVHEGNSENDDGIPDTSPSQFDHTSSDASLSTTKTRLRVNINQCSQDNSDEARVMSPPAVVALSSNATSTVNNQPELRGLGHTHAFKHIASDRNESGSATMVIFMTFYDFSTDNLMLQVIRAREPRLKAMRTFLSRYSSPSISAQTSLFSRALRRDNSVSEQPSPQPQPPCTYSGGATTITQDVASDTPPISDSPLLQAQEIAVGLPDARMTEICQWLRDIHRAVTLYNSAWEWGGGLRIERLFLTINGDFYRGQFIRANIGGRGSINTVTSTA